MGLRKDFLCQIDRRDPLTSSRRSVQVQGNKLAGGNGWAAACQGAIDWNSRAATKRTLIPPKRAKAVKD